MSENSSNLDMDHHTLSVQIGLYAIVYLVWSMRGLKCYQLSPFAKEDTQCDVDEVSIHGFLQVLLRL